MKKITAVTIGIGLLTLFINQSCCHNVACDPPPPPSIILIVSMDSLGSGFTASEFISMSIIKRTFYSNQEQIDTLSNDNWYYESYTEYPDYPRYDLILGVEEGDQNFEFVVSGDFNKSYLIDNLFLSFKYSNSRCCSFRMLSLLSYNFNGQRYETSDYGYEMIIEK